MERQERKSSVGNGRRTRARRLLVLPPLWLVWSAIGFHWHGVNSFHPAASVNIMTKRTNTCLFQSSRRRPSQKSNTHSHPMYAAAGRNDTVATVPLPSTIAPSSSSYQKEKRYLHREISYHSLLTKQQEIALGYAMQKAVTVQDTLREAVLQLEAEETSTQSIGTTVEEEEDDDDEWKTLMGGDGFMEAPDDGNEDLNNLSISEDSAAWYYQQSPEMEENLLLANLRTEEGLRQPEIPQDCEWERLSDGQLEKLVGMTRVEVQETLLQGAVARDTLIRANTRLVINIAKKWAVSAARGQDRSSLGQIYRGSWDRPSLDEAFQEGIEGLIAAVDRYEPQRNLKFSTFATYYVTNKVRRCFQSASTPSFRIPFLYYQDKIRYKGIMREYYTSGKKVPPLEDIAKEMGITYARLQRTLRYTFPVASLDAPVKSTRPNAETVSMETLANYLEDNEAVAAEDAVEMSFLRQALESAMANELTPVERDCLRLRLGLDDGTSRTVKEIAQATRGLLTQNQVQSSVQRAYRKLRSPQSLATYKLLAYLDFAGIDTATVKKGES